MLGLNRHNPRCLDALFHAMFAAPITSSNWGGFGKNKEFRGAVVRLGFATVMNECAFEVAKRYYEGRVSFEEADSWANEMFYCSMPYLACDDFKGMLDVFDAFDRGEFCSRQDRALGVNPITQYTDPAIERIVKARLSNK